jgi:hypothetical protein
MNRMTLNPEDTEPNDSSDIAYYPDGADVGLRACAQSGGLEGLHVLLEAFVMVPHVVVRASEVEPTGWAYSAFLECLRPGDSGPGA